MLCAQSSHPQILHHTIYDITTNDTALMHRPHLSRGGGGKIKQMDSHFSLVSHCGPIVSGPEVRIPNKNVKFPIFNKCYVTQSINAVTFT